MEHQTKLAKKILNSPVWCQLSVTFNSIPDEILDPYQHKILNTFHIISEWNKFNENDIVDFTLPSITELTGIKTDTLQRKISGDPRYSFLGIVDRIKLVNNYLNKFGRGEKIFLEIKRTSRGNEYNFKYYPPQKINSVKIHTGTVKHDQDNKEKMSILIETCINEDSLIQYLKYDIMRINRNVKYFMQKKEAGEIHTNEAGYFHSCIGKDWGLSLEDGAVKRDMYGKKIMLLVNWMQNNKLPISNSEKIQSFQITKLSNEKSLKEYYQRYFKVINSKDTGLINKIYNEIKYDRKIFSISQSEVSAKNLIRNALIQYYYEIIDYSNLKLLKREVV